MDIERDTMIKYAKYKKGSAYSYTLGAFPTVELIQQKPQLVEEVILSEKLTEKEAWEKRLKGAGISFRYDEKTIQRLSPKGNVFVIGIFYLFTEAAQNQPHIVLNEISDMGNLGNICRTMLAMGIFDLITIGNTCDLFHPKTIRASMGALFHLRHSHFETIFEYERAFPKGENRRYYLLMLDENAKNITEVTPAEQFSLFFGNEGSGLPLFYQEHGETLIIPQSPYVDSLNLTTAVAIASFYFVHCAVKG